MIERILANSAQVIGFDEGGSRGGKELWKEPERATRC